MTTQTGRTPMFKDLSDADLVTAYWDTRAAIAGADGVASLLADCGARRSAGKAIGQIFRQQRNLDIIVAISRKRGLSLSRAAVTP
jgi:hypothetical protein